MHQNSNGDKVLRLPNLEAKAAFQREILSRTPNIAPLFKAKQLRLAIESRDVESIASIFEEMIDSSFSYLDLTKEKEYQSMVVALMAVLFGDYSVKSEVVGRYGRCNVLLRPKKKGELGIVIEIKKHKARMSSKKILESQLAALRQIKSHKYYQELIDVEASPIFLYAFVFDGVKMRAKAETMQRR